MTSDNHINPPCRPLSRCLKAGWPLLALLLAACAVGPDYEKPQDGAPSRWQAAGGEVAARDEAVLAEWWRQFNDPVLDQLVADALGGNLDLQLAQARLREAVARRGLARGNLWPQLDVGAGASRSRTGNVDSGSRYNAGFDAGWEIDLAGGLRRGLEAAQADAEAEAEALRNTRVSLVAETGLAYLDLRTAQQRLLVAEATLKALEDTLALVQWRQQAGLVSELDTLQVQAQLEQTRASVPVLRTAIAGARHSLALLAGQEPGAVDALLQDAAAVPQVMQAVATGIPADTLRQRPDVRAAERRLAAETARLGEAEAARYPSLRLSGTLGLEAASISGLSGSDAVQRSLLGSITAPVFDAGRIRSSIAAQDARLEQARLAYRSAVLQALAEVENALVQLASQQQRQGNLQQAVVSAEQAAALTMQKYSAGMADFLEVLDSQRTLLSLHDQLASNSGDVSRSTIQLFKALGGGWSPAAKGEEP